MAKRIALSRRLERYEDFYGRAFSVVDVEDILKEGGSADLSSFEDATRGKTPSGFHEAMFKRKVKGETSNKLGKEIFRRFFENERITRNKVGRIITRTGVTFTFKGKTYKGGSFVPRSFLARRY